MLERLDGVELIPYYLNDELLPDNISQQDDDAVILVNYYGIMDTWIHAYVEGKTRIILDSTQAFFFPPIIREGIFNIYSCRKFIGVSDGAYLIGPGQIKLELKRDISSVRCAHLLKSIEMGTNAAYGESVKNEELLGDEFLAMSELTRRILCSVDYGELKERRRRNWEYVHRRMRPVQRLQIETPSESYFCYPLKPDRDIRDDVVARKIYVPTLWKVLISEKFEHRVEYDMAKYTLCLPIDQRYGEVEMEQMCDIIYEILDEK
jgi:hypothetical protein